MNEKPEMAKAQLAALASRLLTKSDEANADVYHWLMAVWPWRWVAENPLLRSGLIAMLSFAAVTAANWRALNSDFLLKHAAIAGAIFAGFYNAFLVARVFRTLFARLRRLSLVPNGTFTRWYKRSIAKFLGSANLCQPGAPYGVRDLLRNDTALVGFVAVVSVLGIPAACWVFGGFDSCGLPDVARCLFYAFAVLACAWSAHFCVASIAFILSLQQIPFRYYPGMAPCVSLKCVTSSYLQLAGLYSITYLELLLAVYLSHQEVTALTGLMLLILLAIVFTSAVISQIAVSMLLREQKQKRQVEFSIHMEEAFQAFVKTPSEQTAGRVQELLGHNRILARLDTNAFTGWSLCLFVLLLLVVALATVCYLWLSANEIWLPELLNL